MNDIPNALNIPQAEPEAETDTANHLGADGAADSSSVIRSLNDAFRQGSGQGAGHGQVLLTSGIIALGWLAQQEIMAQVQTFAAFDTGNDPYHEHDFGCVTYEGERIFFKIDYYNADLTAGSEDPSDPSLTTRVLTIMLAEEY
jgi:hypothetical protein